MAAALLAATARAQEVSPPPPPVEPPRYTFSWPLDGSTLKPRGGTSRGAPVTLDREPSAAWTALQVPGLAAPERDRRAMRGLNTLQNIDLARAALTRALALDGERPRSQLHLAAGLADIGDAIRVLGEGGIFPAARAQLAKARRLVAQCDETPMPQHARRSLSKQLQH